MFTKEPQSTGGVPSISSGSARRVPARVAALGSDPDPDSQYATKQMDKKVYAPNALPKTFISDIKKLLEMDTFDDPLVH